MRFPLFPEENPLRSAMEAMRSIQRPARRTIRAILVASLLAAPLLAQFSGPSLGADTPEPGPLTPTTDPAILYPGDRPLLIGVGDSIIVHIYGAADISSTERVSLDGTLQVPLIPPIPVLGLTLYQASQAIADRLKAAGMYRDPNVTLQLGPDSPNQVVTFSGEMHNTVPLIGPRGLFSVLSAGGGFPPSATHTIVIHRPGVSQPIVVDLGNDPAKSERADVPIFPHDVIVVPRVGAVYMLGAFKTQGAIPLQQNTPLTLMQATSLGGGVTFEGKFNDLRIVRTVGFERKVIKLDIQKILHGKAPDPVLQADDIVFIPPSPWKAAINNGGLSAATSIASLLLVVFYTH
jgi:polysaccharide export outer membrane protein